MVKFRSLFGGKADQPSQDPSDSENFFPFSWRASSNGPDYSEGDLLFLKQKKGLDHQWYAIASNGDISQISAPSRLPVAEATVPGLRYLPPTIHFEVGEVWTSIPSIPANAIRGTFEVEATSTEEVAARATTDPTPGITAKEWILVNGQAQVIDTRTELVNFKAIRLTGTTACTIRVAFYG